MAIFSRYPERRTVIVNTTTGKAFRGVLWERGGRHLVLRNAELLRPGGEVAPIDGELVIDRENVEFIQVIGA